MCRPHAMIVMLLMVSVGCDCGKSGPREPVSRPAPFPAGIKRAPTSDDALEYWLLVCESFGEDDTGYDNDTTIRWSGFELPDGVIVVVNDSPVELLHEAGVFFQINEWLSPGPNRVGIVGPLDRELYIKVVALRGKDFNPPDWQFEGVVAKRRIPATVVEEGSTESADDAWLEFVADIDYSPWFDTLPDDEEGEQQVREEVRAFLAAAKACFDKHDYDAFMRLCVAPWDERPKWSMPKEPNLKAHESRRKGFEDPNNEVIGSVEDMTLLCGRYCVIAYSGRLDDPTWNRYYSFILKNRVSGDEATVQPMRLVRVSGQWEVW
jgi:hypothetical protein